MFLVTERNSGLGTASNSQPDKRKHHPTAIRKQKRLESRLVARPNAPISVVCQVFMRVLPPNEKRRHVEEVGATGDNYGCQLNNQHSNMPMKTNTPPNPETQDRIQQLKLGVDWHADHFRVVRMCDGQSPQPAQRFTPASFLPFVQKQLDPGRPGVRGLRSRAGRLSPPPPAHRAGRHGLSRASGQTRSPAQRGGDRQNRCPRTGLESGSLSAAATCGP